MGSGRWTVSLDVHQGITSILTTSDNAGAGDVSISKPGRTRKHIENVRSVNHQTRYGGDEGDEDASDGEKLHGDCLRARDDVRRTSSEGVGRKKGPTCSQR